MALPKHSVPTLLTILVLVTAAFAWGPFTRAKSLIPPPPVPTFHDSLGPLPADQWLNAATPPTAAALRGDVVLVEFWTFLCYNCRNVQPWMKAVHARYASQGLQVIGIHSPEFDQERDVGAVRRYLDQNGIDWPIGIDNGFQVWRRYNTTNAWPAFFVYDRRGALSYSGAGENVVRAAEAAIARALADTAGRRVATGTGTTDVGVRLARSGDSLLVTLTAAPGFKVVRSPANEVWLDDHPGRPALLIGDTPSDRSATEVAYFHGPASGAIRWREGMTARGHIVYRYCSDIERICLSRTLAFGPEDVVPTAG